MDYAGAIAYLAERSAYDRGFISNPFAGDEAAALGLRRTRAVLAELGHPDRAFRIIHVAGTKGKGSTCAMIESVARGAGLKTGMYSSPHLHSFRERIRIDGEPVTEARFARLTGRSAAAVERVTASNPQIGNPTAFEISTAMALDAFALEAVDLAIVEVGLGGRLDATNVVQADVSVITSISLDHQAILGNTVEEIAKEKAGIIKPGGATVIGPQPSNVTSLLEGIARDRENRAFVAGRDWRTNYAMSNVEISGPWGTISGIQLGLAGAHQVDNAGVAVMACFAADPALVEPDSIREALAGIRWPGRFELVATNPDVVVDGAHNLNSIQALMSTVNEYYPRARPTVIFGASRDKDAAGMLHELSPTAEKIILTRSTSPRAAEPEAVLQHLSARTTSITLADSVGAALDEALRQAQPDALIVVTGSLYIVAEAREALGLAATPVEERNLL